MANPTYQSWHDMMRRCYRSSTWNFAAYGGRGIIVCARWHDFDLFVKDMGVCKPGYSIERVNNDGNYEPTNCKWIPKAQQAWNRSDSITDLQVEAIKALRSSGKTIYQIRDFLGVGYGSVIRALNGTLRKTG
jgi:hypothetical protein